jgi:hypothetical protein
VALLVAVAAGGVAVSGCDSVVIGQPGATASPGGPGATAGPAQPVPQSAAQAAADLAAIPVRSIPGRDPSYRRDAFGDAWSDAGVGVAASRNGCDTRNDVLKRDARPGTVRFKAGTHNCKVVGGTWVSPYTGATITSSRRLDIDHIVPLARAWVSGAKSWPAQQRLNFANDPDNLLAVDASSNRAKGDLGPSAWRPKRQFQCSYALVYIRAIKKYRLPLSTSDVAALRDMLSTCPR